MFHFDIYRHLSYKISWRGSWNVKKHSRHKFYKWDNDKDQSETLLKN